MEIAKRSRRRHDREVKIANRMRDARDLMALYQPGVKYGPRQEESETNFPPWFKPGRFAKIHPMRVCSCEMCSGDRAQRKRDRAKAKSDIRNHRV